MADHPPKTSWVVIVSEADAVSSSPLGSRESGGVKQKMNVTYVLILTSCSSQAQILPITFFTAENLALTQVQRIVEICAASFVLCNHNGMGESRDLKNW